MEWDIGSLAAPKHRPAPQISQATRGSRRVATRRPSNSGLASSVGTFFEICCNPFFVYNLAQGDIVTTSSTRGRRHMVDGVADPSGRYVFRCGSASRSTLVRKSPNRSAEVHLEEEQLVT